MSLNRQTICVGLLNLALVLGLGGVLSRYASGAQGERQAAPSAPGPRSVPAPATDLADAFRADRAPLALPDAPRAPGTPALSPLSVGALPNVRTISGNPLGIAIGDDSSIQVYHSRWGGFGQVYGWQDGSADSGAWLWVGGEVYGPDTCFSGRSTTNLFTVRPWTRAGHSGPTGSGTPGDPWVVTTVLLAGTTGVRVTQRVSYVDGLDYFSLRWEVSNLSGTTQDVHLFHAVDSYFSNNDFGLGYHDPTSGAVGSYSSGGPWYMLFVPETPASAYKEGWYFDVWLGLGYCGDNQSCPVVGACSTGPGLDNAIDANPNGVDNGFGLEWQRNLAPGVSTTIGDWWTFGTRPNVPGASTPTPTPSPSPSHTFPPPTGLHTATATPTPTRKPGCEEPIEAGSVVRTLAYHQLTTLGPQGAWEDYPSARISANGARAAYAVGVDPTRFFVLDTDGSGVPVQVDSRSGTEGVTAAEVDLSADGSRVMTVGKEKNYASVRVVNADGTNNHFVVGLERYMKFRLSGDGRQVFFQNPEDFGISGQTYKAGLYAASVDSPGQIRKIVDVLDVGRLYGIDPAGIRFAGGDYIYFGASRDGSRFVFSVLKSYRNARVLHVNGDGSGLAEYPLPDNFFWQLPNVGISGDGGKVFYLGQQNPCCSAPYELGVFNYDGSGRTALSDYGGANNDGENIQLTHDGSRLNYLGMLINTDNSGRLELAIDGPFKGSDPNSLVSRFGLYGSSMNETGTRFLFRADFRAGPLQLATLDINPPGLGPAPSVTDPKIAPPFLLVNGGSQAKISARVTTDQTLVRVNSVSLRSGVRDETVNWAILEDEGASRYANTIRAQDRAPLGQRMLRIRAEVRAADGKRHSTAIDVDRLDVVDVVPPGLATCTPSPSPTATFTRTPSPTSTATRTSGPPPTASRTGTPTVTPTPTVALPDLTVSRIEVNQAVQNPANGIPLIAYKRTVVRAFIGIGAATGSVGEVAGRLAGFRGSTALGTVDPFNPNGRIDAVRQSDWKRLNDTLNFEVPFSWLTGDVRLEVQVNPNRTVVEANDANNTAAVNAHFVDGGDLRIAWLPIHYITPGYSGRPDPTARIAKGEAWLKSTFPVSHTRVKYYPWPGITWGGNVNFGTGALKLIDYLGRLFQLSQARPRPDHLYGWLPGGVYQGNGLAYLPGHTGFGNDTDERWRRTLTHEVGHNRSLPHNDKTIGTHGFDVAAREVRVDSLFDVMVPARLEREAWVMPQSYLDLFDRRSRANPLVLIQSIAQTPVEVLLVSGFINQNGTASFNAFYRQTQSDPAGNPPAGTGYCVELVDTAGARLDGLCFDVSYGFGDSTIPMTTAPFLLTLPYPPSTRRVVLKKDGATLAARTVSNNAPTVSASPPSGGVVKTLNWSAADADGDALSYSVLYSADNKLSWYALATDLAGTTFDLDTTRIPGGLTAYVRVLATDGVNTGEADAGPFSVTGKEPTALIGSPANGAAFAPGESVMLTGEGTDPEDGALPDGALNWSSDLDGPLGAGRAVERGDLRVGKHLITLTVVDGAGNSATDVITLYIRWPGRIAHIPIILQQHVMGTRARWSGRAVDATEMWRFGDAR